MNDKEKRILEVTIDVISRYGVRKTTMGDIASEAGISRQTLYASYAGKEEVLAAAVRYSTDKTLEALEADWRSEGTMSDKLDAYLQHCVIAYYDIISKMPDSEDLITGYNAVGMAEQEKAYQRKKDMLASILKPYEAKLSAAGSTPAEFADFFVSASANLKFTAESRDHLLSLLASLKKASLALLGQG